MSSRALRRLQKEQELTQQLSASQTSEDDGGEDPDEDTNIQLSPKPRNAFDMLEGMDTSEEDNSEPESNIRKSIDQPRPASKSPSHPSSTRKKKKKKSKKKQKADPTTINGNNPLDGTEEMDEIDRALQELSTKHPDIQSSIPDVQSNGFEASGLLAIDPKKLNPTTEMRSLFGNIALEGSSSRSNQRQPQRRRDQNQQGGLDLGSALSGRHSRVSRGKELGTLASRKNIFMQGREEWPLATSGGLGMDYETKDFNRQYNIVHNNAYTETQFQFYMQVETMDPQRMIALLLQNPYHIASLLQVSEIAKHQGDHSVSGDLLERALFTFGRSVHSTFPAALREGRARVPFVKPSNRELYLAMWRYIRNLEMRGTWQTAFEWSKALLQLDPLSDPYGVTLMIDQYALRGRQHAELITLCSDDAYGAAWRHLPNIQISLALAYLRNGQPKEARKQLAFATKIYPFVVSKLTSILDIQPSPKSLWGKLPSTEPETLYTELYVTRAKDLWNTPETTSLLVEVAETLHLYPNASEKADPTSVLEISLEEARHIILLEIPPLIALLPRRFTTMNTTGFDVLPPPSDASQSEFTARAPRTADGSASNLFQFIGNAGLASATTLTDLARRAAEWFQRPVDTTAATTEDDRNLVNAVDELRELVGEENMARLISEAPAMAGGFDPMGEFDYYVDALQQDSHTEDEDEQNEMRDYDSMPELEDLPDEDNGASDIEYENTSSAPHHPHAATVEEDAEEETSNNSHARNTNVRRTSLSHQRAVLRHIDSDESDSDNLTRSALLGRPLSTLPASAAPSISTVAAASTATDAPSSISPSQSQPSFSPPSPSTDPQRLQRWLLSTGLSDLQTSFSSSAVRTIYAKRLRSLDRKQRDWVLSMIRQRLGTGDGNEEVRQFIGSM